MRKKTKMKQTQEEYQSRSLGDRLKTLGRVLTPFYIIRDLRRPIKDLKLGANDLIFNGLYSGFLSVGLAFASLCYGADVRQTGSWNPREQKSILESQVKQKERERINSLCWKVGYEHPGNVTNVVYSFPSGKTWVAPSADRNGDGISDYILQLKDGSEIKAFSSLSYALGDSGKETFNRRIK